MLFWIFFNSSALCWNVTITILYFDQVYFGFKVTTVACGSCILFICYLISFYSAYLLRMQVCKTINNQQKQHQKNLAALHQYWSLILFMLNGSKKKSFFFIYPKNLKAATFSLCAIAIVNIRVARSPHIYIHTDSQLTTNHATQRSN